MTKVSTEVKTHIVQMRDKDYYITADQQAKLMQASSVPDIKGIWLEGDYVRFAAIESIRPIPQPTKAFMHTFDKTVNRTAAIESMIRGLDRAVKETCGSYNDAKAGTVELRRRMVKKLESLKLSTAA